MSQMNSFLKHTILVVFTALFLFGSSCSSTYKKTIADTYCKRSKKPEKVLFIHEGSYGHINFIYQKDSKEFLQFIDNALKRYFNAINIHYDKQKKYYTYNYSTFQNTTYLDASDYSKKKKINKMHKNIILK